MTLLLISIGLIVLFFVAKTGKKKKSLVKITTESKEKNVTEIKIDLNEKEFGKRLRGDKLHPPARSYKKSIEEITGLYGTTNYSENKQYCVSFCDGYHENERWKNGKVALVKGESLLFKKTLQRPNECHVSNDGIVICCDWLNTEGLRGLVVIFSSSGEQIFSYKATANLGACGISSDSSIAVFETYASETEDADSIFIIDTNQKQIVSKFPRPHAFNKVQIHSNERVLNLIDHRGFKFKVDFEGNQTNIEEYEKQILTKGSIYDKLCLYESKPDSERLTDKYRELLVKGLNDKDASYAFGKDKIYRKLGEYYQASGDVAKTTENWEKAVQLNPKVGVKRKLEALKKG